MYDLNVKTLNLISTTLSLCYIFLINSISKLHDCKLKQSNIENKYTALWTLYYCKIMLTYLRVASLLVSERSSKMFGFPK